MALTPREKAQRAVDKIDEQIEALSRKRQEAIDKVTAKFDEKLEQLDADREHAADAPALRTPVAAE